MEPQAPTAEARTQNAVPLAPVLDHREVAPVYPSCPGKEAELQREALVRASVLRSRLGPNGPLNLAGHPPSLHRLILGSAQARNLHLD